MRIGILKSYILHKEAKGCNEYYILKIDSSKNVLLQVEKEGKVVVKQRIANYETAKDLIKTAVVGRDQPRAFDKDSPSNSPFSNDGGGGLLKHVEEKADKRKELKEKFKNRKERKKTVEKGKSKNKEDWSDPDGGSERDYSLISVEFGRDDGEDTPGYNNVLRKDKRDMRPPKPVGDDPLTTLDKPEETKPNYDKGYGTDNDQNYEDRSKQLRDKTFNLNKMRKKEKEQFIVYYEKGGKPRHSRPMTLEKANEMKMKNNNSRIERK